MGGFFKNNPEDTVVGSTDSTEDTINETAVTETDSTSSFYRGSPEQTTVDGYVADAAGHATAASTSASDSSDSASDSSDSASAALASQSAALVSENNASDSEAAALASQFAASNFATTAQNLEVASASFDTADGTLTLTKANSGIVTTDFDGRYAELSGADFTGDVTTNHKLIVNKQPTASDLLTTDRSVEDLADWAYLVLLGGNYDLTPKKYRDSFDVNQDNKFSSADAFAINLFVGANYSSAEQATYASLVSNPSNNTSTFVQDVLDGDYDSISTSSGVIMDMDADSIVTVRGDIAVSGTVDGRDVLADGNKLDLIEASADVTDATNVTAAGAAMLTGADFTGSVTFPDSVRLKFGGSDELKIYYDPSSTSSFIKETGEGNLVIQANNLSLNNTSNDKYLRGISGGETKLYFNNYEKLNTRDTGVNVTGNITLTGTVDGVDIATLNSNAVVDGDFTTAGIMTTDGLGGYSVDASTYLTTHQDISGKANLSGATFTGNVNIGTPPSGTQSLTVAGTTNLHGGVTGGLDVTGDITVTGTVDGVDIATRDAVLTTTTTTANSALQDLVGDTTPQLGGDLSLNGKVISGTGRLYINQASTSNPAVHLISGDTSDAASPTIRLERFSTTTVDDDSIGKIEFYGYKESLPPIFPTVEYANITGVINDATNLTIDGQLDFNLAKDDTLTTAMSLTPTTLELTNGTDLDVEGDIIVDGTVDGRDVAADGTKLDSIKGTLTHYYWDSFQWQYGANRALTTTPTQYGDTQFVKHSGVAYKTHVDLSVDLIYSSTAGTNDATGHLAIIAPLPAAETTINMGTCTTFSTGVSYIRGFSVVGDWTEFFSRYSGLSKNSDGSNAMGNPYKWFYSPYANTTTVWVSMYSNAPSNGDTIYLHPFDWESSGTVINGEDLMLDGSSDISLATRRDFKIYLGRFITRVGYKFMAKEVSSSDVVTLETLRMFTTEYEA